MNQESWFRVVFNGHLTGEFDLATTRQRFQQAFNLSERNVNRVFSRNEYILRDGLTEDEAWSFALRLAEIGCECFIEEISADLANAPDSIDRRAGERRLRFRRAPRPGAIVPDRRSRAGRRKSDEVAAPG